MSEENKAIKILNLYALFYHKEMLALSNKDRDTEPNLNEFLELQVGREKLADLILSSKELHELAKALEL
jgi:hypothetical protein